MTGKQMIKYLVKTLDISRSMLASSLEVTERGLETWESQNKSQLTSSPGLRLRRMYQAIKQAIFLGVPQAHLFSLMVEPLDKKEDSPSPLYYIVEKPKDSNFFTNVFPELVKKFIAETPSKSLTPSGYNVRKVTVSELNSKQLANLVEQLVEKLKIEVWIDETPDYSQVILTEKIK